MNQAWDFFVKLLNNSGRPPRWYCGQWTAFHRKPNIINDLLKWSSYFSLPISIIIFILKKQDVRFVRLYFLFAAFIPDRGTTWLSDTIVFIKAPKYVSHRNEAT